MKPKDYPYGITVAEVNKTPKLIELRGEGWLGWYRADVFLGPLPLVKLVLVLLVVIAVGVWR